MCSNARVATPCVDPRELTTRDVRAGARRPLKPSPALRAASPGAHRGALPVSCVTGAGTGRCPSRFCAIARRLMTPNEIRARFAL